MKAYGMKSKVYDEPNPRSKARARQDARKDIHKELVDIADHDDFKFCADQRTRKTSLNIHEAIWEHFKIIGKYFKRD